MSVLSALARHADALARAPWLPSRLRAARQRPDEGYGFLALTRAVLRVRVAGRGPRTLVLVPDPPNVLEHHTAAFATLAGDDRRVVGFELPGFGFSLARPGYGFDLAETRDVVLELLAALDLTRVTLAFSCVAGLLALAVARAAPSRVERVITVQTAGLDATRRWARRIDRPGLLATPFVGQLMMAVAARPIARRWYHAAFAEPAAAKDAITLADTWLRRGASFSLASGLQALHTVDPQILLGVHQPVTAIFGERDRTHRHSRPDSIQELVPHAQLVPFARSGHFPDLEEFERFAGIIAE
jgi:pimeloyl-ACP methyl ester carboxylesterase